MQIVGIKLGVNNDTRKKMDGFTAIFYLGGNGLIGADSYGFIKIFEGP